MPLNKNDIRQFAIDFLTLQKFDCWKNNNIAVRGRNFIGRLGVPDVAGIHKLTGKAIYCEVKAKDDDFSKEQIVFLNNLEGYGGFAYVAYENDKGQAELCTWYYWREMERIKRAVKSK